MSLGHKTVRPTPIEMRALDRYINNKGSKWEQRNDPGVVRRCRVAGTVVTQYKNGKVLIQGKGTQEMLQCIWPHYIELNNRKNATNINEEEPEIPYMGADESGKGDYFGPLVVAAVHITPEQVRILKDIGVRDSKALTDKKILDIYPEVLENSLWRVKVLEPKEYNIQYSKINNLNSLLAWLHRVNISKLIEQSSCKKVVVDKFAKKSVLLEGFNPRGVEIVQTTQAEDKFTAVAAASIVARTHFLYAMEQMSQQYGLQFPKGAHKVVETGSKFVQKYGFEALSSVAKLHFKTTLAISKK